MVMFFDGVLIACGLISVFAVFSSGHIGLLLIHDRIHNETIRRINEDRANTRTDAQAETELKAHNLMINDPMINKLVRDLANHPYVSGQPNVARGKLQIKLRNCVKSRSVRGVMLNMQF